MAVLRPRVRARGAPNAVWVSETRARRRAASGSSFIPWQWGSGMGRLGTRREARRLDSDAVRGGGYAGMVQAE